MSKYPIIEYTLFNANRNVGYSDPTSPLLLFRGSLLAKIAVPPSDTMYVVVLHLNPWHNDDMNNIRLEEIKGILKLVAPLKRFPILLMGDFNALSPKDGSTGTEALTIAYLESQEYRDAYRFLHPNPAMDTGKTNADGRIDYVFSNNRLKALQCYPVRSGQFGFLGFGTSDHLAVSIARSNSKESMHVFGSSSLNWRFAFPNRKVVHGEIVDLLGKPAGQRP